MSGTRRAAGARVTSAACLALLLWAGVGCHGCPPDWYRTPPSESGWLFAAGRCGEVFVDADPTTLALGRAARSLADQLGLRPERRLSVRHLDGRLFVEAADDEGLVDSLDRVELVDLVDCDGTIYALLRLPLDP